MSGPALPISLRTAGTPVAQKEDRPVELISHCLLTVGVYEEVFCVSRGFDHEMVCIALVNLPAVQSYFGMFQLLRMALSTNFRKTSHQRLKLAISSTNEWFSL